MNVNNEVNKYQKYRRESTAFVNDIRNSVVDFYTCLSTISSSVNTLPIDFTYRKRSINETIAEILQSVDQLQHELGSLNTDCSMKIHALITKEKMEQSKREQNNAKSTNARLARRFSNNRK